MVNISLEITAQGGVRMLHDDAVDLSEFGAIHVTRASHVEYDDARGGYWYVQSAKTLKILATRFGSRAEALAWEKSYYSPGGAGWKELTKQEESR